LHPLLQRQLRRFGIEGPGAPPDAEAWKQLLDRIGAAYQMDAWTFGLQYSHRETDFEITIGSAPFDDLGLQQDRIVATVAYAIGPGMTIDGELGYTWIDTDPEFENAFPIDDVDGVDDYDAIEIGIGTNFTF